MYCTRAEPGPRQAGVVSPEPLGRQSSLQDASSGRVLAEGGSSRSLSPLPNPGTPWALVKLHPTLSISSSLPGGGGVPEPSVALRMLCLGSASSCMAPPSPSRLCPAWKQPLLTAAQMPLSLLPCSWGLPCCDHPPSSAASPSGSPVDPHSSSNSPPTATPHQSPTYCMPLASCHDWSWTPQGITVH